MCSTSSCAHTAGGINESEHAEPHQNVDRAAAADDQQKLVNENRDNDDVKRRSDGEWR